MPAVALFVFAHLLLDLLVGQTAQGGAVAHLLHHHEPLHPPITHHHQRGQGGQKVEQQGVGKAKDVQVVGREGGLPGLDERGKRANGIID